MDIVTSAQNYLTGFFYSQAQSAVQSTAQTTLQSLLSNPIALGIGLVILGAIFSGVGEVGRIMILAGAVIIVLNLIGVKLW